MSIKRKNSGVSPVIGVVIMVAITVIMGVIIAQFFFNITDRFTTDASATFDFTQQLNVDSSTGDHTYTVTVRVINIENSDYLAIRSISSNDNTFAADYVGDPSEETRPADVDYAPDTPSGSSSIQSDDSGAILLRPGDKVTINNLDAGDSIQVFGRAGEDENMISEYTVQDVVPEAYK